MGDLTTYLEDHLTKKPKAEQGVYVARGATVLGDAILNDSSSVWYNAVVRGDRRLTSRLRLVPDMCG